jgi:hypothetical protein
MVSFNHESNLDRSIPQASFGGRGQGWRKSHRALDAPSGKSPAAAGVLAEFIVQVVHTQLRGQARSALLERQL